jgi:hypothetical protein
MFKATVMLSGHCYDLVFVSFVATLYIDQSMAMSFILAL